MVAANPVSLSYLASPYNHPDDKVMQVRFEAACRVAGQLIAAGVYVFSPIAHNVPILRQAGIATGWQAWAQFDGAILARCDRLVVLMLDGWESSHGVQAEIALARERGMRIVYVTEQELSVLLEGWLG